MQVENAAGAAQSSAQEAQRVGVAEALLALPEHDAELAWQQLPRKALLTEVSKYRDAIRDVAGRLRELGDVGIPASEDDLLLQGCAAGGSLPQIAGGPDDDPDGSDLLQLGDEGLEYTLGNVDDVDPSEWQVPPHCVPIHANVTTFDWRSLYEHCQFDVIMMDPPWQLATANPTRGVALGYSQLTDEHIASLPVPQLQRNGGFLFVWVINAKYKWTLDLFDKWGYRLVDEVVWVKMTVNRRLAKSHGYYLQHAKEVCLVAKCGNPSGLASADGGVGSDIIFSERRGQSQKPEEIYELIEQLVPNGRYLEIFARKNNLRDFWVSIGNEVTGTGLPEEDMRALKELNCIPGAVYGKTGGGGGGGGGGNATGRSASAGSGPAAVEPLAAGGGGGVAGVGATGPSGRAASSGGTGAVAAAGTARGASGATSSGAGQAGRGRTAPCGLGQSIGGGTAVSQPCLALPPKPSDVTSRQGAATAATGPDTQSRQQHPPNFLHQHTPSQQPLQQPPPQEGALKPPSRLSLSIRIHRQRQQQPQPTLSPVAEGEGDGDGAQAMDTNVKSPYGQGKDNTESGLPDFEANVFRLQGPCDAAAPHSSGLMDMMQGGNNLSDGSGEADEGSRRKADRWTPLLRRNGVGEVAGEEASLDADDELGTTTFHGEPMESGFAEADDWT